MRTLPATLVALALVARTLLPAGVRADEFSEYRIPEHSWRSGALGFSTNAYRSQRSSEAEREASKSSGLLGSLDLNVTRGYDSDRRQHAWQVRAAGAGRATHDEARFEGGFFYPGSWGARDNRTQSQDQSLGLAYEARLYPGRSPFGLDLSTRFDARWSQRWNRNDENQHYPGPVWSDQWTRLSSQDHRYDYSGALRAGFGHGRVRDATPVEDVHLLEERLLGTGALARPLSAPTREKLAGILAVSPQLHLAHDRPARYLWREIERVLAEDGALAGDGLDAYSLRLASEPNAIRGARRRGHFAGVTLSLEHRNDIARGDWQTGMRQLVADTLYFETFGSASTRTTSTLDEAWAGVWAEWHRPAGWNWQWGASGSVELPVRPGESGLRTDLRLEGSWRVADRWLAQAGLAQRREYVELGERDDSIQRDRWSTSGQVVLSYFLEDRTTLSVRLEDGQSRDRRLAYWMSDLRLSDFTRSTRLSAGLTWRFLGGVAAPGLFEPMSLLR